MNKILTVCFIVAGVFVAAVFVFKIPVNNVLLYGSVLLCPLMHFFMMKHGDHAKEKSEESKKCH